MGDLKPLEVVLSIVDPEYPKRVDIEKIAENKKLFKSTIRVAKRNGLYYYFINRLKNLNLDLPFLDTKHWEKENKRLKEFKESIHFLNDLYRDKKIEYLLIKAFNTVPNIPNDIDIFVQKERRQDIINVLEDNGMECIHSSVTETKLRGKYFKIDIYTEINYIGVEFIGGDFLWESKVMTKIFGMKYPGLNKESDLLLTFVHGLFGHRSISLLDFLHVRYLKTCANIGICRRCAYKKGWREVFDLILNEFDILHEKIYKKGDAMHFPYLFKQNFILKCVSGIEGLDTGGKYSKVFLYVNLIQDRIIYELKETSLYNFLKSFELVRNFTNSLAAFVKKMRGDTKSTDKREWLCK